MNNHCRHCKEPLPPYALHFSNEAAIEKGYCCYFCLSSALGEEKALKILQKYQEKRVLKPVDAFSEDEHTKDKAKEGRNATNSRGNGKGRILSLILEDDPEEARDEA